MLARVRTVARSVRNGLAYIGDHRLREFHSQRKILGPDIRDRAARELVVTLPKASAPADPGLAEDGLRNLGSAIDRDAIKEVRDYLAPRLAHDPYRPQLDTFTAPNDVPPATHVACYDTLDVLNAPHLLQIASGPDILSLVEGFIGAKPTIAALSLWWSLPTADGSAEHAQLFHRDVDDLRFLKLFVYLTDVDEDSGPHIYALGSHRRDVLTRIERFTVEQVEEACGKEPIRYITGPAGTTFLEATYGLHRGLPPRTRPRLVFQALYALRPLIYGPKRPLRQATKAEAASLDHYVNRCFLRF